MFLQGVNFAPSGVHRRGLEMHFACHFKLAGQLLLPAVPGAPSVFGTTGIAMFVL